MCVCWSYSLSDSCCYNKVQYNMILHSSLQWLRQNKNGGLNPQQTPISRTNGWAMGVSFTLTCIWWPIRALISYNIHCFFLVSLGVCKVQDGQTDQWTNRQIEGRTNKWNLSPSRQFHSSLIFVRKGCRARLTLEIVFFWHWVIFGLFWTLWMILG